MSYRHLVGGVAVLGAVAAGTFAVAALPAQAGPAQADAAQVRAGRTVVGAVGGRGWPVDHVLSNRSLTRATQELVKSAKRRGDQRVTMVIMERSGVIRLVVRTRKAGPQTYESAKRKAYTAVAFGQPTSALTGNETIKQIPGTLVLPGGVPILHKGFPIAGIGVGGAPDGRIDEAIATDVRAAMAH
ncbi:heme-binding protein [Actinomadura sp. 9N215]|uniref:heme-binding protein n=1 Tax=Actinomadura sp. 9N215 TaxID=3375150 RepID=UPI0037AE4E1E